MISCDPKAPKGMFRVIWFDSHEHIGGLKQDFPNIVEAINYADQNARADQPLEMLVNDDSGTTIYEATDFFRGTTDKRVRQLKSLVKRGIITAEAFVDMI